MGITVKILFMNKIINYFILVFLIISGVTVSLFADITTIHISKDFTYGPPVMNDNGVVAFWYKTNDPNPREFILKGNRANPDVIATTDSGSLFTQLGAALSINDNNNNMVAFWARYKFHGVEGIFMGDGKTTTKIAQSGLQFSSFGLTSQGRFLSINSNNIVAFEAFQTIDSICGLFAGSGGSVITVMESAQWGHLVGTPWIDDNDYLYFWSNAPGIYRRWIYGGKIDTLEDSSGPVCEFNGWNLAVNSSGTAVFIGREIGSPAAIYTTSIGHSKPYSHADSSVYGNIHSVAIDNKFAIVFLAKTAEMSAIYVKPPSTIYIHPIVQTGDAVANSYIKDINFSREGLNNIYQIAFYAELEDGRKGIFKMDAYVYMPPAHVDERPQIHDWR